jgi:putative membrane protein
MKRASKVFTEQEKDRIQEAIAAAEAKTHAEIVPVVATASGRYDRAEDIVGLWLGLILMAAVWFVLSVQGTDDAQWGTTLSRFELPLLIVAVIFGFLLGAFIGTYTSWLRRMFTSKTEMKAEVTEMAQKAFYDQRVHHTGSAGGVLIYISLFERMAAIVGDQAVLEKLSQSSLDELCQFLIEGIQEGDTATALCGVIQQAGERLAALLPRTSDDENELSDALIFID